MKILKEIFIMALTGSVIWLYWIHRPRTICIRVDSQKFADAMKLVKKGENIMSNVPMSDSWILHLPPPWSERERILIEYIKKADRETQEAKRQRRNTIALVTGVLIGKMFLLILFLFCR